MTDPMFIADIAAAKPGSVIQVAGTEGHHAAKVKRITVGENVLLTDGAGKLVRGQVSVVSKNGIGVTVTQVEDISPGHRRVVVVQALAKGERSELAVQMLTEMGVDEIVPWAASRSVVRWVGEREEKAIEKWRSTARESMKQSRQCFLPKIAQLMQTSDLVARISGKTAFVLHEDATDWLVDKCISGNEVWLIVGPEGGITPEELAALAGGGAEIVKVADSVLRTSTAGIVGIAQLGGMK